MGCLSSLFRVSRAGLEQLPSGQIIEVILNIAERVCQIVDLLL